MSRSSQSAYDRHITIFSPDGNLYQVEYAMKAVKSCNLTAIAVKGVNSVCIVSQKKVPTQQLQQDKLLDPSSVTSMYNISDKIGAAMIGMAADCKSMVVQARQQCVEFAYNNGYDIPLHWITQRIADINQLYTQHAYMRLHACTGIFVGIDQEFGPSIYRFDSAGFMAGYKACAAGSKEQEATNVLEKMIRKKDRSSPEETIQAAISSLQSVLSIDFKSTDIEVGVATVADPKFRRLTEDEIEYHLIQIAEKD